MFSLLGPHRKTKHCTEGDRFQRLLFPSSVIFMCYYGSVLGAPHPSSHAHMESKRQEQETALPRGMWVAKQLAEGQRLYSG